jgi:tRNA-Thr(GGU) m(6)t(6)A37 methyltransferase TsaA
MKVKPIGVISTPFKSKTDAPIQPFKSKAIGKVKVYKKYQKGLKDIDGFSHIILLFEFNRSKGYDLLVRPFLDDKPKGLFATRAPRRPNQIGMSVVELIDRKGNILTVKDIDVLDKTPLIDIKPFVPRFSARTKVKIGWLKGKLPKKSK